mgnify:CR=1 FL=1
MRTNLLGYALGSESRRKVVQTILEYPKRQWTCSSLEEAAKINHATVFRMLAELRKYGIMRQFKLSRKMVVFELVPSPLTNQIKIAFRAEKQALVGIAKEFAAGIKAKKPLLVILYGSVAQDKIKPGSDIDLFVLLRKPDKAVEEFVYNQAGKISLKYNQTLSPVILTEKEFKRLIKKKDKFISNVMEGEVIYGKSPL